MVNNVNNQLLRKAFIPRRLYIHVQTTVRLGDKKDCVIFIAEIIIV